MLALVDERYDQQQESYPLACVLLDPASANDARAATQAIPRNVRTHFHRRHELDVGRLAMTHHLAQLEAHSFVVVATPVVHTRQERARRLCLWRMLYELATVGVDTRSSRAASPTKTAVTSS